MIQGNKNFITNLLHLAVNIFVGLLYTPYLIGELGVTAYGVIPLALVINQYINVISNSLINALTRFYSIEYRSGDNESASKYFSTSIAVTLVFAVICFPFICFGINYIDRAFDIPQSLLVDAKWLFLFTVSGFFVSILSNAINTTLFADNLLNKVNYLKITRQGAKFLFNVLLFIVLDTNIMYVGLASFISEILVLLLSILFYAQTKPIGVHFRWGLYDKTYLFTMMGLVVWVLLQRFADTFLYKIDSILMNIYFGIKMTGVIGAISELGTYVISITGIIASLFGPILLITYSKKEIDKYKAITVHGSYIVGLFTALLCGLLCGSATDILTLWLGSEFRDYGWWLIIKVAVIPYTTVGAIFANSYLYANKNKYPALISVLIAFVNVGVNILILSFVRSITSFLVVCSLFVVIQGLFMNVYFYKKIYENHVWIIIKLSMKYSLFMLLVAGMAAIMGILINVNSLVTLVSTYMVVGVVSVILMDAMFLTSYQRELLYSIIPIYSKIRKVIIR